jgi:pimeloyl-ACP methyl ester carboxylesterase
MLAVKLALWVLFALAIVAVGYLGVALFVATWLSTPSRQPEERTPYDVGLTYREVSLRSTDGLVLAGWWVPGDDLSKAVVLVPGLEGDKSDRHVLETAPVYARAGYGVLMVDLRAQGRSEGERVTMGYREVQDVRAAHAWLKERGFAPHGVVLHGFSMGGATVLRAAPGTSVAAVVVDSAYADLPLILRQRLPEVSGLPPFFTPGVMLAARLFLNLDPWAVQPEEDTRRFCKEGVHLLIIHSTGDKVVPFGHASRLKEACPRATFWKIEGYEHVGAYAHPEYEQKLLSFLKAGASA